MPTPGPRLVVLASALLLVSCAAQVPQSAEETPARTAPPSGEHLPAIVANLSPLPSSVDLRPRLTELGLTPRPQGARGTCSIFTTCEAIEFAFARRHGKTERLSPEYVNWAGAKAAGGPSDGNFFHNALAGFDKYGICTEKSMPYARKYDAKRAPSADAAAEAKKLGDEARSALAVHWIVPWAAGKQGVDDQQFNQIKRVLANGYPVAAGSAHSRLLVGYTDDAAQPGGGTFITEDSALNRFDAVSYEFVRKDVNDVFWIEAK